MFSSSAREVPSASSPSSGSLSLSNGTRVTRVLHHEASRFIPPSLQLPLHVFVHLRCNETTGSFAIFFRLTSLCSVVGFVCGSSVQFLLFDPKALRFKPSQLPATTIPIATCESVLSFHPQHSLLLWCIGTAAFAGHVVCVRCSDGSILSSPQPPCHALADPSTVLSCVALDDVACIVIACSNGALLTAKLSGASAASQFIDFVVLLPPATSASAPAAASHASGKKRTKEQQQKLQCEGHVSITAIAPSSVAVAWSARASQPPLAAVYDCAFGSRRFSRPRFRVRSSLTLHRRAGIDLQPLDISEPLVMARSNSLLVLADASSVFCCDIRAHAQHVSLADAVAASSVTAGKGALREVVFTQTLERLQEVCLSSLAPSSTPATGVQDLSSGSVNVVDSQLVLDAWQQQEQQLQNEGSAITCAMVVKRMVSPSTAAAFVNAAAAAGNWSDVMACVRGGGVALSHCPSLVTDAAAAGQTPVMFECLLRCVDVLEADVACALTHALHSGTPSAFQSLAVYIASAPASSASSSSAQSTAATAKKSKGKNTVEKASSSGGGSGSGDGARRALLHAALRARVSEVRPAQILWPLFS